MLKLFKNLLNKLFGLQPSIKGMIVDQYEFIEINSRIDLVIKR